MFAFFDKPLNVGDVLVEVIGYMMVQLYIYKGSLVLGKKEKCIYID